MIIYETIAYEDNYALWDEDNAYRTFEYHGIGLSPASSFIECCKKIGEPIVQIEGNPDYNYRFQGYDKYDQRYIRIKTIQKEIL